MSDNVVWAISILGLLISLVLWQFILRKHRELKALQQEPSAPSSASSAEGKRSTQNLGLRDSLSVICTLLIDQQVEISEGCIRIRVLLDHYNSQWLELDDFAVFREVHDALSHMPTHQARKQTDKKIIQKLDQERFAIEERNAERVHKAAQALRHKLQLDVHQGAA